jgi:hypothetical protein
MEINGYYRVLLNSAVCTQLSKGIAAKNTKMHKKKGKRVSGRLSAFRLFVLFVAIPARSGKATSKLLNP